VTSHTPAVLGILLPLIFAVSAAIAADNSRVSLGQGYAAELDSKGVVRILRDDEVLLPAAFVGTWLDGRFSDQATATQAYRPVRPATVAGQAGMIERYGVIPRQGTTEAYQVYARASTPGPDGVRNLILTHVFDTALPEKTQAALIFRLPAAEFTGRTVSVDGTSIGTLPKEQPRDPIIHRTLHSRQVVVTDGGRTLFSFTREDAGQIIVQDGRRWGSGSFEIQFYLSPARGQPASRSVLQLLLSLNNSRGPAIATLGTTPRPDKEDEPLVVPKFGLLELSLDFWAQFENPYDSGDIEVTAQISQPDRTTRTIRGFYFLPFQREIEDGKEKLSLAGLPDWRIRFSPTQTGPHSFVVFIKTRTGSIRTVSRPFLVVESKDPGHVSLHADNRRHFQLADGRTLFLFGHNVAWGSDNLHSFDYDEYFQRMSEAGENFARVWMASWDMGIEGDRMDNYRQDAAARLDHVIALAERYGIYLQICLDNENDYAAPDKRKFFGCWKENGGHCSTVLDFFTLPAAKAAYQRRLDYVTARWGYSPHVLGWELWNESDFLAQGDQKLRTAIIDWTAEMAAYLKSRDPGRHLVTTSLGSLDGWNDIWKPREIDYVQAHVYLPEPDRATKEEERDVAGAVLRASEQAALFGKPFFIAEFGHRTADYGNPANEKDAKGSGLRTAIWAGLFSGAAGTPAAWWWQTVHKGNLYSLYTSAARFLQGIDLAQPGWLPFSSDDADLRIRGVQKSNAAVLWIQRRRGGSAPGRVEVRLSDVRPGEYEATWWNPAAGEISRQTVSTRPREAAPDRSDLVLTTATDLPDIAVRVEKK